MQLQPAVKTAGVTRWYATATDTEDRKDTEEWMRNEKLALREQIDRDSISEDIVGSSKYLRSAETS